MISLLRLGACHAGDGEGFDQEAPDQGDENAPLGHRNIRRLAILLEQVPLL